MCYKSKQNNRYRLGFTLIEIIVVVVILAIVAAIAIPSAISTGDLQVISAARIIAADLQYAQKKLVPPIFE